MKSKLILPVLVVPMFCLTACGGSNDIFNKTFEYKGVISCVDEQLFEGDNKTAREWLTQEFNKNNIDWTVPGAEEIPHSNVDEIIKYTNDDGPKTASKAYGDVKIVVGSKESKTAAITFKGETANYTFDPEQEMIIDFKDNDGYTCFTYTIAGMTNGVVDKGYLSFVSAFGMIYEAVVSYTFTLIEPVTLGSASVTSIPLRYYANIKN